MCFSFNAVTLFVGRHEEHLVVKLPVPFVCNGSALDQVEVHGRSLVDVLQSSSSSSSSCVFINEPTKRSIMSNIDTTCMLVKVNSSVNVMV